MMSKHFKKHISDLSDRQFCRRIKSETEKVLRYVFENIKSDDDDTDEGTRKELLGFASYEEQYAVTTESLDRPCSSSKQDPLDRPLHHQNQCENKFEEVLDIFDEENCHIDINCLDSDSDPIDSDIEWFDNTDDTTVVTPYLPEYENVMSDTECSIEENENKEIDNTKEFLRNWKLRNNISHTAVTELLRNLKLHSCFQTLPTQSKTLINTPRNKVNVIPMAPGGYMHIDGIPLFKSGVSLWPIVGSVKNTRHIFLIGAYYGPEKPYDSNLYLSATVNDIKDLMPQQNHIF
ncbi:atp synthase subunit mitochondrial [Lasius niger]|uniref:Atp synthase subunit mitochondrial n=1 Tax=Lasius niger TaxID=67767 RepID=A0A0J7K6S8_LASNI|nr:atp synthase subunit mitochondrial [Lasius niger]